MPQVVEKHTLPKGTGLSWEEVDLAALEAQAVTENTVLDNPQQMTDTLRTVTPSVTGIHTFTTKRVQGRISKNAWAKTGGLAQNAIQRRKDADGILLFASATVEHGGSGTTMTFGHVAAAVSRAEGNATEPATGPYRLVHHPFPLKDIADEIRASVGTYEVTSGLTAKVFAGGDPGMIAGAQVFPAGNIVVDGTPDARGGVFPQMAILLVQGFSPWTYTREEPHKGGGGDSMWLYDEYAYAERTTLWLVGQMHDATTPTS
tara:strand:- start:144 stop:923 length:780 start_codon:yes stop_codon:yes gene_type:complete